MIIGHCPQFIGNAIVPDLSLEQFKQLMPQVMPHFTKQQIIQLKPTEVNQLRQRWFAQIQHTQTINSTFTNKQIVGNIEILSGPQVRTGVQDLNLLFGIGMECNKVNLDNFGTRPELAPVDDEDERYIYKVDVGSMRGLI